MLCFRDNKIRKGYISINNNMKVIDIVFNSKGLIICHRTKDIEKAKRADRPK